MHVSSPTRGRSLLQISLLTLFFFSPAVMDAPFQQSMRCPPGLRKTIIEVPPKEQTVHLP